MIRNVKFARRFCSDGSALRDAFLRSVKPPEASGASPKNTPISKHKTESKSPPSVAEPAPTPLVKPVPEIIGKTPQTNSAEAWKPKKSVSPVETNLLEFAPSIKVIGVGGGGCNAVNNMINRELLGVDFVSANTDAQHLAKSCGGSQIQLGRKFTQGLGCGADPNAG